MTKTYVPIVPVTIQSDSNGQLQNMPSVYPVTHGQSVDFVVEDPIQVVVSFDQSSCLTKTGPFYLDGSDPTKAATGPLEVLPDAAGRYPFTVAPDTSSPASGAYKKPGDFEAKQGELEVSPDPEEDEEKGKGKGKRD
ncbi:hypothetical protein [Archangium violaceum]|uniref:Uncharacterized protein n=1 Tax=Archangium violaceum Cb vi76 TaxID=1406225 RepID=A0A084SKX1_9BACT|nr:hypothetical protein [Archangium violaceum]KFA89106.1 hypothetical protein Q664_37060 [Archangium violaceum Cb vi76]